MSASVYILLPTRDEFVFALVGARLYEALYSVRSDLPEVYRRLAYTLDRFWADSDRKIQTLFRMFRLGAAGLSTEIVVLITMVSDSVL